MAAAITAVTEAGTGEKEYTVAAVDATNGVITITATFTHTADPYLAGEAVITGFTEYRIGETLTVNTSGITGGEAPFIYQWQADGEDIDDADEATYTIQGADAGKEISCVISHDTVEGEITAIGGTVPYNIVINFVGNETGDDVTATPDFGHVGDVITLNYTIDDIEDNYRLVFSGTQTSIAVVENPDDERTGEREYTINASDADNGVITITATFAHTESEAKEGDLVLNITVINEIGSEKISFDIDEDLEEGVLYLDKGESLVVEIAGDYENYLWRVNGELIPGNENTLDISIEDYTPGGTYQILVIVYKDAVPYSREIYFSVNQEI